MKTLSLATGCLCLAAALGAAPAQAGDPAFGIGLRAGTLGIGADLDFKLNDSLNVRMGYAGGSISRSVTDTQVHYDGTLKLSNPSALIDWRPFQGVFHLTAGAVASSTKIEATGVPAAGGSYTINGNTYTSADIGSVSGEFKFGNSVAPYVGLGWGNVVGTSGHFSVLFDVGAIYAGSPKIALTANCTSAVPAVCTQLQSDVDAEKAKLAKDLTILKWYPVVSLGFGYRF